MTAEVTEEQRAAALSKPPARPRATRTAPAGQAAAGAVPAPAPVAVPRVPSLAPAGVAAAMLKRKQREAGQALLPVLSKLAKLQDDVEMCTQAVAEALAAGVDPAVLRRECEVFADKAGVDWELVPAQIRDALNQPPSSAADGPADGPEG